MAQTSRRRFLSQLAAGQNRGPSAGSRPRRALNDLRQALRGVHSYLPTPFHADLEIDPEGMRQNAAFYANAGVQSLSLVVAAGLGELFSLGFEEHREVVRAAAAGAGSRIPVVAGVRGGYRFALRMARNAEEAGADAILVFPPPGGPQTLEGQRRYFTEIARSVGIGVLIYPRTQRDDWSRLLDELADLPNVLGFKDGSRGIELGQSLSPQTRKRLVWTARGEEHALLALPAGATAYATSFASLAPRACHEFFRRGIRGDTREMEKIFRERIAPLADIRWQLPLPDRSPGFGVAAIKAALESLGRAGGSVRPPKLQVGGTARIAEIAAQYSELTEA